MSNHRFVGSYEKSRAKPEDIMNLPTKEEAEQRHKEYKARLSANAERTDAKD